MGIPITVNKDENISSVENGTFVFCKELSKGFIKREFTDSVGGYELRVNWYGNGNSYAKYSKESDTVNYVRLTTGLGDPHTDGHRGYEHTFFGFGGHHDRPAGGLSL